MAIYVVVADPALRFPPSWTRLYVRLGNPALHVNMGWNQGKRITLPQGALRGVGRGKFVGFYKGW